MTASDRGDRDTLSEMQRCTTTLGLLVALATVLPASCARPSIIEPNDPNRPLTDGGANTARDLRTTITPCGNCMASAPVCDLKSKKCVGCVADSDCPTGQHCQATQCKPTCSAQAPCGDAGVCNLDGGVCAGCTVDGQCGDPKAPFCDQPSGRCVPCDPKADRCPDGKYCASEGGANGCQPGCKTNAECINQGNDNAQCCAHACDDTGTSVKNCGACGTTCAQGESCCGGGCADVANDISHCGACGVTCNVPRATSRCAGGNCQIAQCQGGWGDCDRNALNGCETNFDKDDYNCGRCGKSCVFVCVSGSCFPF